MKALLIVEVYESVVIDA